MKQMVDPKSLNFDDKYLSLEPAGMTNMNSTTKGYVSILNFNHYYEYNPTYNRLEGFIQLRAGEPSSLLIHTRAPAQAPNIKLRLGSSNSTSSEGSSDRLTDYKTNCFYRREYSKTLTCFYPDPAKVEGSHYMLTDKTVKTIFGQSIYSADGTGNIDLYKHNLKGVSGDNQVYISIPSSKNTPINSITDLNTYLSNDDYYPATGVYKDGTTFYPIVFMTKSNNVWSVTYNKGTGLGTALISAVAGTITDTVTTV